MAILKDVCLRPLLLLEVTDSPAPYFVLHPLALSFLHLYQPSGGHFSPDISCLSLHYYQNPYSAAAFLTSLSPKQHLMPNCDVDYK